MSGRSGTDSLQPAPVVASGGQLGFAASARLEHPWGHAMPPSPRGNWGGEIAASVEEQEDQQEQVEQGKAGENIALLIERMAQLAEEKYAAVTPSAQATRDPRSLSADLQQAVARVRAAA